MQFRSVLDSLTRSCGSVVLAASLMHGAAHGAGVAGAPSLDPLVRPSTLSERAKSSLMTAVARAGTRLVAVGERGTILTSDDHGLTWLQRLSPVSVMLTNVRFGTPQKGWAVGHGGVVLATADAGVTWSVQLDGVRAAALVLKDAKATPASDESAQRALADAERLVADGADKPFLDLLVDGDQSVMVVGAYGLAFRSDDGGATWSSWQSRIPNVKGAHLYAIRRSGDTIYLAGELGSVFKSTDKGQTFAALTLPYAGSLFGVAVTAPERVVVIGLRGNAYASLDGGQSWTQSRLDIAATLTGATELEDGSVVTVSQAGNVLRSTDGGKTFAAIEVKLPVPFVGVVQAADGSLVMAGVRGMTRAAISTTGSKS